MPETTTVQNTVVPETTTVQDTVVPETTTVQNTVVPETTTVQDTVVQPVVLPTTTAKEIGLPQTTVEEEILVPKPLASTSIAEEIAGKTVGKEAVTISRRNNQPQSEPILLYNPSLRLIPRHEPADVISSQRDSSLIDWLEASGKMLPRDPSELEKYTEEEEEISELIAVDDNFHDDEILDENADDSGD